MSIGESMQQKAEEFRNRYFAVRDQIARVIVGHDEIVHGVLTCLFVGGHCLLEGLDDIGLTLKSAGAIRNYEQKLRQQSPWLFDAIK